MCIPKHNNSTESCQVAILKEEKEMFIWENEKKILGIHTYIYSTKSSFSLYYITYISLIKILHKKKGKK